MLSRLSDQRNSLLWIRCRLRFVRQNSSRSFAQQVLGDCMGTVQVRCANLPNRSWPNRLWAFFLTLASCGRPTSAGPTSARIKVLPFFTKFFVSTCFPNPQNLNTKNLSAKNLKPETPNPGDARQESPLKPQRQAQAMFCEGVAFGLRSLHTKHGRC